MAKLLEEITVADRADVDLFGVGEHHREEFVDASPAVVLAAAAGRTSRVKLTSAVAVLSAADPVRLFQDFATLDLVSNGRAELTDGRGSFVEAHGLFGVTLDAYDEVFIEKLELLLQLRRDTHPRWQGRYSAPLSEQGVFPRPLRGEVAFRTSRSKADWLETTPHQPLRCDELGLSSGPGALARIEDKAS